jgi:hypothetical protein
LFFPAKECEIAKSDPELGRKWTKIRSQLQDPVNFLLSYGENMLFPNALTKVAFKGEKGKDLVKFGTRTEIERYQKASKYFEKMLTYRIIIDSLYISEQYSLNYIGMISRNIAYKSHIKKKKELLSVASTNFWAYVLFLGEKEHQYTAPYTKQLTEQERAFQVLINASKKKFAERLRVFSPTATNYMCKISGLISLVNESSTLYDRYVTITSFMDMAFELAKGLFNLENSPGNINLVINFFIVIYDAIWVYRTVVFMQKFLFGSQNAVICPFTTLEQWNHFFTAILKLISKDKKLLADFTQISMSS